MYENTKELKHKLNSESSIRYNEPLFNKNIEEIKNLTIENNNLQNKLNVIESRLSEKDIRLIEVLNELKNNELSFNGKYYKMIEDKNEEQNTLKNKINSMKEENMKQSHDIEK